MEKPDMPMSRVERKIHHHLNQDGLGDVYGGILFILAGLAWPHIILLIATGLFARFLGQKLLEKVRCRYTYPRLGYVKLPRHSRDYAAAGVMLFYMYATWILGSVLVFKYGGSGYRMFEDVIQPALMGLTLGLGCIYAYYKFGGNRFLAYFPLSLCLGVYFAAFSASPADSKLSSMMVIGGLILLIPGLLVFYRFVAAEEPQF